MTTKLRDVAERAGVSVGTVSNVLNRPSVVRPATASEGRARDRRPRLRAQRVRPPAAGRARAGASPTWCSTPATRSSPTSPAASQDGAPPRTASSLILCNSDSGPAPRGRLPRPCSAAARPRRADHPRRRRQPSARAPCPRRGTPWCWSTGWPADAAGTDVGSRASASTTSRAGVSPSPTCSRRARSGSPSSADRDDRARSRDRLAGARAPRWPPPGSTRRPRAASRPTA